MLDKNNLFNRSANNVPVENYIFYNCYTPLVTTGYWVTRKDTRQNNTRCYSNKTNNNKISKQCQS